MILYDLATVIDCGTYWKVTNIVRNTLDSLANKDERLLKLSFVSAELIKIALLQNKTVHITKNLTANEVLPFEVEILDDDKVDPLLKAKNSSLQKVRMLVTPDLSKISGFALYGFIVLNNDLSNAGYFITNDNREEKYLEILETGDEKLISKLEDYLNYRDELENISHLERKFSAFRSEIKMANSIEEVKTIEERFLERFYSTF